MDKRAYDKKIEGMINDLVEARQLYEKSAPMMRMQRLDEWQALRQDFSVFIDTYHSQYQIKPE